MARHGEDELRRVLGVPDEVWLGSINLDWNQLELGRGSDASVHRAVYGGAHVAVKVLHSILIEPDNVGRRELLQRFGGECRILRRLAHPRVIRFVGIGMAPNTAPCLVLELMHSSLASRVGADPPDSFVQSLTYFLDIAEGLRFLHSQGLLHRDLKPQNVLITAGRAKIADVGLARFLNGDDAVEQAVLTRCPGTPHYMPPECFVPSLPYNMKLDVFSLGVTALSVLGGRAPAPSEAHIRLPDGSREAVPEHERRGSDLARLPARHPMRNLILSCLQDDPNLRPSAESLHVQLMGISHRGCSLNNDQATIATVITHLESVLQRLDLQSATISQLADQANATERRMAAVEIQLRANQTQQADLRMQRAVDATEQRVYSMEEQLRNAEHRIRQDVAAGQRTTAAIHRCVSGLGEQHRATQRAVLETKRRISELSPAADESPLRDCSAARPGSGADTQLAITTGSYSSAGSSGTVSPTSHIGGHDIMATSPPADHHHRRARPSLAGAGHEDAEAEVLARCGKVFMHTLSRVPKWTSVSQLPVNTAARCYRTCVHNGFLYAAVSLADTGNVAQLFRLSLVSDGGGGGGGGEGAWTSVPLPAGQWHWQSYLFSHAGLLYAILVARDRSGFYSIHCTSDLHNWQFVTQLDEMKFKFGAHVHASRLYVIGGNDGVFGGSSLQSVHRLDLASPHSGWVRVPALPGACILPHVVTMGDSIHCVGYYGNAGVYVAEVMSMEHSPPEHSSQRWVMDAVPSTPVAGVGAAVLNGNLVIVGGERTGKKQGVDSVFAYHEDTRRWMSLPPLNTAVRYPRCFSWSNELYYLTGNDIQRLSV